MAYQWALCKCGRSWRGRNKESLAVALCRCRSKHIIEDALCLAEGPCNLSSSLFLILSHRGNHGVDRTLSAELKSMGASKVHVVYGFKCGEDFHMGKKIAYNQVVHYGFLHRWLPLPRRSRNSLTIMAPSTPLSLVTARLPSLFRLLFVYLALGGVTLLLTTWRRKKRHGYSAS